MKHIAMSLALLVSITLLADDFSGAVDSMVAAIDMSSWYRDTEQLTRFNRFYRSDGVDDARDWLVDEFTKMGLLVHTEAISIGRYQGINVVAEIIGTDRPDEIYIVGAHYDATSEQPMRRAPGAEDNASGTAALLTLARALVQSQPKATIRFVAFSGEEAGLFGSEQYVDSLIAKNEVTNIRGVLIMDMIGYSGDSDLDALIESSASNQPLIDLLRASAARYTNGRIETSYHYWGSDHVPFIDHGFLAALLVENDYDDYPDYHRSTDEVSNLNPDMARVIIQMVAGVLGLWVLG